MSNIFITNTLKILTNYFPVVQVNVFSRNRISITVSHTRIPLVLELLKSHASFQFKSLTCISGVDYPNQINRFKVVYELLSLRYNARLCITTFASELSPVPSVTRCFQAASWYESEIWDMFGVFFGNHPNLTKLLSDYGFEGYPLRKDFPLSGFVESNYDYTKKQVLNAVLELSQEFKSFQLGSPWETYLSRAH